VAKRFAAAWGKAIDFINKNRMKRANISPGTRSRRQRRRYGFDAGYVMAAI